ncbi:MAG: acyl-CoA synthetase [Acidobacteria bacterium]|nr:MAG: acyl-CoA synthetase [Acidobacteriota bacterium]REK07393.1 MAG: acyl-CoA synthetase [Acidobacteriota bacterium]
MYPGAFSDKHPDRPAVVLTGSSARATYGELEAASCRLAQHWHGLGLRPGDHVAAYLDNRIEYFEVFWAAIRSGLYLTPVNRYLAADEAAYIVEDCGAKALVASAALPVAAELGERLDDLGRCPERLAVGGAIEGYDDYGDALAAAPARRLDQEPRGRTMFYSSGTTGRPKGIKRPLTGETVDAPDPKQSAIRQGLFAIRECCVYLSPAPLYHAAPLAFTTGTQAEGGTVVVMEKFDAEAALAAIELHRATTSQWVPTMFSRMLKLPREIRERYDVSSLEVAVHAAAPCPVEVKRQMIEWWGPILREYYAGSEGNGTCFIDSTTWLSKPGSVGRPVNATVHVCDEEGAELPAGSPGTIYFEQEEDVELFEYHNDPGKTSESRHPHRPRWTTLGDVGYLDEDGFLFLTDRKAFMIISGGVNIYPQEIENVLVLHPKVLDVAVIGVPHEDMGEEVKAVVEPAPGVEPDDRLAEELEDFARQRLASFKVPRSFDFVDRLPRLPTGKLYKQQLRARYWPAG